MQHQEFDYNTVAIKSAIKNGTCQPLARGNGRTTTFPLGLPQETRDRLATLSTMTGEPQAEIIRQAIDKILDEGIGGVKQGAHGAVRAHGAIKQVEHTVLDPSGRKPGLIPVLDNQEKGLRATALAEDSEIVSRADSVVPPATLPIKQPEVGETWVHGGTNRTPLLDSRYWRAPRGSKTVT